MRKYGWLVGAGAICILLAAIAIFAVFLNRSSTTSDGGPCNIELVDAYPTVAITVDKADLDQPRVTVSLTIRIPAFSNPEITDRLFAAKDEVARRQTVSCLLLPQSAIDEGYGQEWRDAVPSVALVDGIVTLHDKVHLDLWGKPPDASLSPFRAGVAEVSAVDSQTWQLAVVAPTPLWPADWELSVQAPAGWLASPASATPQAENPSEITYPVVSPTKVTWPTIHAGHAEPASDDKRVAWALLQPDLVSLVTASNVSTPWILAGDVLTWFSGIALAVVALMMMRERGNRGAAPPSPSMLRRLSWPAVIVMSLIMLTWLVQDVMVAKGFTKWVEFDKVLSIVVVMTAGVIAALCYIRPRTIVIAAAVAVCSLLAADSVAAWPPSPYRESAVMWLQILAALIASLLIIAGMLNAVRLIWVSAARDPQRVERPTAPVWLIAIVASAVLLVERAVLLTYPIDNLYQDVAEPVCCLHTHAFYLMVDVTSAALLMVSVALIIYLKGQLRPESWMPDDLVNPVILLFLLGSAYVEVWILGFSIPIWPWLWLLMAWWLRRTEPFMARAMSHSGYAIQSMLNVDNRLALRTAALEWHRHVDADAEPKEAAALPAAVTHVATSGARRSAFESREYTPIDVLMTAGPGRTPWGNAERAASIAFRLAIPFSIGWLALLWAVYPPSLVNQYYSILLQYASEILWQLATWTIGGVILGLLWHLLPGRRGPSKVLPLIAVFALPVLIIFVVPEITNGVPSPYALPTIALFAVILMMTSLRLELEALNSVFTRKESRKLLFGVYGAGNLGALLAMAVTYILAALTIIEFFTSGNVSTPGNAPQRPGQ